MTTDSAAFRAERVTSDGTGRRIELVGVVAWVGAGLPPTTLASTKVLGGEDTVVAPGFIDLQVNGYYSGHDCAEGADAIAFIAARLPETGVTSFLPPRSQLRWMSWPGSRSPAPRPGRGKSSPPECWERMWKDHSSIPTTWAPTTAR